MKNIRRSYQDIMRKNHPDKNNSREAGQISRKAQQAYSLIDKINLFAKKVEGNPEASFSDMGVHQV